MDAPRPTLVAYASRQIVISAGAFGSPAILERWATTAERILCVDHFTNSRSGIGASKVLRTCDIEQFVDLPGVGEKLKGMSKFVKWIDISWNERADHNVNFVQYHAAEYAETLDPIFWGGEEGAKRSLPQVWAIQ